ncbi:MULTISPECIES: tol-pal system YbgF family protein [unclassified Candidatus Cardinium]|uniref:tetratricopeptide repeat protein n=1 Tax=unclassified Candidatus Cardinium TaxID=2641185 RepID=UPI001FB4A7A6|nr:MULTISPECIES: tetratricopeptide repeat protein [unclassified Candidatus Cardinium]
MKTIDINSIPRKIIAHSREKESLKELNHSKKKWYILLFLIACMAAASWLWFLYLKPTKSLKAEDEAFQAVYHFEAGDFDKALKGDGLHKGLLEIIKAYPGTTTANLACFYTGIAYMHQKQYDEALAFLSRFKAKDFILQARAWSVMGDAHSEQKNHKQAAIYYIKAAHYKENSVYSPGYLIKAAIAFETDGQYKQAYDCYQEIIAKYPTSRYNSSLAIKESNRLSATL